MFAARPKNLEQLERTLLREKGWRYLRYLHLREGFLAATASRGIETVHCLGAGKAYAEIALALEFPDVRFHITDVESERTPNYQVAEGWVRKLGLPNVTFGTLDIFDPPAATWDLVTSVETLEHLEDDETAVGNMHAMADAFVFALVPFADEAANADPARRERVWKNHEHFRVGYDEKHLRRLFPGATVIRGCYFKDAGHALRLDLAELDPDAIERDAEALIARAKGDVRDDIPKTLRDALGVWVLADAS